MIRERFARRLLLGFGVSGQQLAIMLLCQRVRFDKFQGKLINYLVQRFGLRAEPLPPQISKLQFEFWSQNIARQKI